MGRCIHGLAGCFECQFDQMNKQSDIINRIEKLECLYEHHLNNLKNKWEANSELTKRLIDIENYMQMEDRVTASDVLMRLDEIDRLLSLHGTILRKERLAPWKCPVCEGYGRINAEKVFNKIIFQECIACDSKGIIWG